MTADHEWYVGNFHDIAECRARIEALEAVLRNIEYIDTSISYDGKDREYGECAKMARIALDKETEQ
jgi:hypothetical protein